jgi:rRNA maturation endonuclease Nob1
MSNKNVWAGWNPRHSRSWPATIVIIIIICVILAITIFMYPTCPECSSKLEVFTDEYCANCGAYARKIPFCQGCNKAVNMVTNGYCDYCGTKVTYNVLKSYIFGRG